MITSKTQLNPLIQKCIDVFEQKGEDAFVKHVHEQLLKAKIRFPLLEHAAEMFCKAIPGQHHYSMAEKIMRLNTIGGNVLVGIILRNQFGTRNPFNHGGHKEATEITEKSSNKLTKAIRTANAHIVYGNQWYVCDIIGERVAGYALLTQPDAAIPFLQEMSHEENKWIVRTVGVATHYAVKKGLKKKYAEEMFAMLLTLGSTTDFHTRKGIGWAVKTIAKFHPDIIETYRKEINGANIQQWFKTKIGIGLGRSEKYASRYKS